MLLQQEDICGYLLAIGFAVFAIGGCLCSRSITICMAIAAGVGMAIAAVHAVAIGPVCMHAIAVLARQLPLACRNSLLCVCCAVALGKDPEGVQDRPVSSAAAAQNRAQSSEMSELHTIVRPAYLIPKDISLYMHTHSEACLYTGVGGSKRLTRGCLRAPPRSLSRLAPLAWSAAGSTWT